MIRRTLDIARRVERRILNENPDYHSQLDSVVDAFNTAMAHIPFVFFY
jgi:hypothetical protein